MQLFSNSLGHPSLKNDVELVAEAIDAGLSERRSLEEALADYERQRNEMALPLYEYNAQAASMKPRPPEMQQLFAALQGNQKQTNRFFGIAEGTTSIPEFFAPENVARIIGAASKLETVG